MLAIYHSHHASRVFAGLFRTITSCVSWHLTSRFLLVERAESWSDDVWTSPRGRQRPEDYEWRHEKAIMKRTSGRCVQPPLSLTLASALQRENTAVLTDAIRCRQFKKSSKLLIQITDDINGWCTYNQNNEKCEASGDVEFPVTGLRLNGNSEAVMLINRSICGRFACKENVGQFMKRTNSWQQLAAADYDISTASLVMVHLLLNLSLTPKKWWYLQAVT